MKKSTKLLIITLTHLFFITSVFSQSPQKMSYQAVVRDNLANLVANHLVGLKISILQGSASGSLVYTETLTPVTNVNGLISIEFGGGAGFSSINWANGPYFLKTETDPSGGTDYSVSGTSQLLSVPFALYAQEASPLPHTHGNISNNGKIGSDENLLVMTGIDGALTATPGSTPGEILYWNGTAWVKIPAGDNGQVLTFSFGVPTWASLDGATSNGPVDVLNPITGKTWMDRNLGATRVATGSTDVNAYGHLYQWGRGNDGHQLRTSSTTTTLSSSDIPGHGNFILITSAPYDWRNPQNDILWQGVDGVNNPCPAGYRLPTYVEWNAERQSWISNNSAGAFASPLKLTVAGFRYYTDGLPGYVGLGGYYWSSSLTGTLARNFLFGPDDTTFGDGGRAYGCSVRCIKN